MRGKIETRKIQEEVQSLEDQILGSYLVEFKEKNPELFRWHLGEKIDGFGGTADYSNVISSIAQLPNGEGMLVGGAIGTLYVCCKDKDGKWKLEEKINGFEDASGDIYEITSIAQLPNGEGMLVGGGNGVLYVCRKGEDGKWKLEEKIDGFESNGSARNVESIASLPDKEGMLVGGEWGKLYVCRKGEDGKWKLGEKVDGFVDTEGHSCDIYSIASLPDKEGMLVGGDYGTLHVCRKGKDGIWRLGEEIKGLYTAVHSIAQLPDGEGMLVGGELGDLYVCRKGEDGKWKLEEKIEKFENRSVYSIAPLPDGEGMLVGGELGDLYVCRKDEDGRWKPEERIGFKDIRGKTIASVAQLPNGDGMLVGGIRGALHEVSRPDLSVDTIKQNLDSIIQKGAV
jgi:ketosteroid isomerase-like protein